MNNNSSGIGCFLIVVLIAIGSLFKFIADNPALIIVALLAVVAAIILIQVNKKSRREEALAAFLKTADKLDALAATNEGPKNISLALNKGERALFALYNTQLVEYASTGSSYSGTSVGVSVPLFGRVRGNVGKSQGSITKNPEQLTVVDTGTAIYTNQRIIFTGAKLVRNWEFDKILNMDVGPNGTNVRIAVSNNSRTSGLQAGPLDFGAGLPAGYAYTWFQEGEAPARKWLKDTAKSIRDEVEAAKKAAENTKPVSPMNLDAGVKQLPTTQPTEPDPDDPASAK